MMTPENERRTGLGEPRVVEQIHKLWMAPKVSEIRGFFKPGGAFSTPLENAPDDPYRTQSRR